MRLEKTKNTKRNILFGLLNKAVMLFCPFILRTIVIKTLGAEYLGLNNLFSSILQVLNLSELGFGSAVVYSMYRPIAEQDKDAICALLNFYRKIYRYIGCGVLLAGIALMPFLPHLISGEIPGGINIYVLYLFYLVSTASGYLMFSYKQSLLNAHQRQDIVSNTLTLTQGMMYIFQICMLLATKNYYLYLVWMPVFSILNNIINAVKVDRMYPEYVCRGKIHERERNQIKTQVPGLMITKLCYISRNSFDSIFISSFLGLTVSAIYGNYYYVMNALYAIVSIFSNSILAGVGNSMVNDSTEDNYNTMNKINFIYMWISGWCTICLICLYQPFMRLWVGEAYTLDNRIMLLFCIYFYILAMGTIRGVYSDAAGLWWKNRYRAIAESVANIILNYVLVIYFGLYGILLATILSLLIINFAWGSQIVFDHYFKNNKVKEYFWFHLIYASVTGVIACITGYLCRFLSFGGFGELAAKAVLCCVVPNVLYILIYHRMKLYQIAVPWLLRVMGLSKLQRFFMVK